MFSLPKVISMISTQYIADFEDITSENPIEEVWKLLRFFCDNEYSLGKVCQIHKITNKDKQFNNAKKQAIQIGYCIRQAEEYFQASSKVGLTTRPNLLYYGASSLSKALILLKNDGSYSIDALRTTSKHNHHGLEIDKSFKSGNSSTKTDVQDFFKSLKCSCYSKVDNNIKTPWGNFPLFYESLIPGGYLIEIKFYDGNQNYSYLKNYTCQPSPDIQPINEIINKKFNGLELIKTLPDMYLILEKLGIETNLCRGNIEIIETRHYETDSTGQQPIDRKQQIHNFGINAKFSPRKMKLLNRYMTNSKNPLMLIVSETDTLAHTQLITQFDSKSEIQKIEYYPEIVDDINGINFFIVEPGSYLPEIIAQFILLFCFGMICRYAPDIWIKTIDENVIAAELIDSILGIIYRKFPNLILDQMTQSKHYIHL